MLLSYLLTIISVFSMHFQNTYEVYVNCKCFEIGKKISTEMLVGFLCGTLAGSVGNFGRNDVFVKSSILPRIHSLPASKIIETESLIDSEMHDLHRSVLTRSVTKGLSGYLHNKRRWHPVST